MVAVLVPVVVGSCARSFSIPARPLCVAHLKMPIVYLTFLALFVLDLIILFFLYPEPFPAYRNRTHDHNEDFPKETLENHFTKVFNTTTGADNLHEDDA